MKKTFAKIAVAVVISGAFALPAMGVADAQAPNWPGYNHPGASNPADPFHSDWHCDRTGKWHNDEHDAAGHPDGRCRAW